MNKPRLLEVDTVWEAEWHNMPGYNNEKQPGPLITATFQFMSEDDYNRFHEVIKKHLYSGGKVFDGMQRKARKVAWYPLKPKASDYRYV